MSGFDDINVTTRISAVGTTLTANDYYLSIQGATGAVAIVVPAPSAALAGRVYIVAKDSAAQTITLTPVSGNIDGAANVTLASGAVKSRMIICDGTAWWTASQL